jgi:hypothetical protein
MYSMIIVFSDLYYMNNIKKFNTHALKQYSVYSSFISFVTPFQHIKWSKCAKLF